MVWTELLAGNIRLCVSTEIIEEYEEILSLKTNPEIALSVISLILSLPGTIKVTPRFCLRLIENDPDDNKFVDCAFCGEAELIVTNDAHFTVLKEIRFPRFIVLTIEEFLNTLTK